MTFVEVPKEEEGKMMEALKRNLCVSCYQWVGVERVADGDMYCHKCDDEMPEPELELGQRVRYEHSVARRHSHSGEFLGPDRIWTSVLYGNGRSLGQRTPTGQGIVVGKRTISDGQMRFGMGEDENQYVPSRHFTAWLVAYDLRRKPVHVLSRHIRAIPVQMELGQ